MTNLMVVSTGLAVTDTYVGLKTVAVETKDPVLVRVMVVSMVTVDTRRGSSDDSLET